MVIINHFRSEQKWLAPLVDMVDPITRRLGWRTTLRFSDVAALRPFAGAAPFQDVAPLACSPWWWPPDRRSTATPRRRPQRP